MKYFKRSDQYRAANVVYDVASETAHSYDWWCFVKRIKGQLVFNQYPYSRSTQKHQFKVSCLLQGLGVRVDRYVNVRGGLSGITTLKDLNALEKVTLELVARNERWKRERRNKRARERRAALRIEARREAMCVIHGVRA